MHIIKESGSDEPPGRPHPHWRVAVLANIKDESQPLPTGVPADAYADFDHIETIDHIRRAIETDGHETGFLVADENLPASLKKSSLISASTSPRGSEAMHARRRCRRCWRCCASPTRARAS